jgi:hypothetical protein
MDERRRGCCGNSQKNTRYHHKYRPLTSLVFRRRLPPVRQITTKDLRQIVPQATRSPGALHKFPFREVSPLESRTVGLLRVVLLIHAGGLHVVCRDRLKRKILVGIRLPHKSPHDLQPVRAQIISTEVRQIISQATAGHLLAVPAWLRLANWWHLGERGGSQDPTET